MRHFFARAEPKAHATRRCECRRRALRSQALEASGPLCPRRLQLPAHHTPKRLRHPAHRAQALAGLGLSAPGTFGFHTAVRQSPTVCHTPRLLAHVVSHAIACNATWFRTVFNPAPQAPAASGSPFATQRASLHTWFPTQLCAMQPSSARFPAYRPHGRGLPNAPPLAPAVSHTAPRAFAAC